MMNELSCFNQHRFDEKLTAVPLLPINTVCSTFSLLGSLFHFLIFCCIFFLCAFVDVLGTVLSCGSIHDEWQIAYTAHAVLSLKHIIGMPLQVHCQPLNISTCPTPAVPLYFLGIIRPSMCGTLCSLWWSLSELTAMRFFLWLLLLLFFLLFVLKKHEQVWVWKLYATFTTVAFTSTSPVIISRVAM